MSGGPGTPALTPPPATTTTTTTTTTPGLQMSPTFGPRQSRRSMDIGWAILIVGFLAVFAALLLLLNGLVYSEMTNSEIPRGVANRGKLHVLHGLLVGVAMTGRILERLGICHQVSFTRWFRGRFLTPSNPVPPGLRIKDRLFAGVPVRVYEPTGTTSTSTSTSSSSTTKGLRRDSADEVCRYLAKESGTTVVSVGYRLAPEHHYPAPLDDCRAATCHFLSAAEAEFGVDPRRVAVGGDGPGGNMAAALCLRLATEREEEGDGGGGVAAALRPGSSSAPPCRMADFSLPSYQQNRAVPPLFPGPRCLLPSCSTWAATRRCCPDLLDGVHVPTELRPRYLAWLSPAKTPTRVPGAVGTNHRPPPPTSTAARVYHGVIDGLRADVSPLLADDLVLGRSPPTFLLTCEFDVLRDDGLLYRRRLLDLGVPVAWQHVGDGFHGVTNFVNRGWLSFPAAARALDGVVDFTSSCPPLSRTREDKWSEPGWRIEQRYANKVLIGKLGWGGRD
ncbi:hypothetical protein CRUP_006354 [Coryphaenoides rupestris]|nr:hypothetical protein CRUP_006354 [Coryphaenoides rupestris]